MRLAVVRLLLIGCALVTSTVRGEAATYMVGPGHSYATPAAVPWESL